MLTGVIAGGKLSNNVARFLEAVDGAGHTGVSGRTGCARSVQPIRTGPIIPRKALYS